MSMVIKGGSEGSGYSEPRAAVAVPPPLEILPGGATNLFANSRLIGDTTSAADAWTLRNDAGTVLFAASEHGDNHRKVTLTAAGAGAAIQVDVPVTAGERYYFQAVPRTIGAATSPTAPILNHVPFASATVVDGSGLDGDFRPKLGEAVAGEMVWYAFDANETRNLTLIMGIVGANSGAITMERPQIDAASELRLYAATGAAAALVLPTANPDSASTAFETMVNINVLGNDVAGTFALDAATVAIAASPSSGSAVPQVNGTINYTPATGFSGDVTFTYTVADTEANVSNAAAVLVAVSEDAVVEPPPSPPPGNLAFQPYRGEYIGQISHLSTQQNAKRLNNSGYFGTRYTVRRAGTIAVMQHQLASNRLSPVELSKSTFLGKGTKTTGSHVYPANWPVGMRVFRANSSWQISGAALRDIQWTYTNPNGVGGTGLLTNNSRVIFEHVLNLAVEVGDRLLFLYYNRSGNPLANCPGLNTPASQDRPPLGQNPARAVTLYYGDDPITVRGSGSLSTYTDHLYSFGVRYTDEWEDGSVQNDSNSQFNVPVGQTPIPNVTGTNFRARQTFTVPLWSRFSQVAVAAGYAGGAVPNQPLIMELSGGSIGTVSVSIPRTSTSRWGDNDLSHKLYNLGQTVTLAPGTTYTVLFRSSSTSGNFVLYAMGHFANGISRPANSSGSFVNQAKGVITPNQWSGNAQKSSNGGSSWSNVSGKSDLPVAFRTNFNLATTQGGLT